MLTPEEIKYAWQSRTKELYLGKICAQCSDGAKGSKDVRKEDVSLYVYLYRKHTKRTKGIFSLCTECDERDSKEWGPSYPISAQELFVYLMV